MNADSEEKQMDPKDRVETVAKTRAGAREEKASSCDNEEANLIGSNDIVERKITASRLARYAEQAAGR